MNIDWFTFAAQIVNFLLLVGLLRWLLYGPIVRAMEERESKIADRLNEAQRRREEADERTREFQHKSEDLDERREQLIQEAKEQAAERRKKLLSEAKEDVRTQREAWHDALQREREDLIDEFRQEAAILGLHAARQTLSELAGADLEMRMCDAFAERIQQLEDERRDEIAKHLNDGESQVCITSQFDLDDDGRDRVTSSIRQKFDFEGEISFEKSHDLICGIELEIGGFSFGWNIRDFLKDMERRLNAKLKV